LLKQQRELEGLTGGFSHDYRDMKAKEATDGGKGMDFRENKRFSAKMKAHDFENEIVLADAIRFLFRRAESAASIFGENEETVTQRLPRMKIPFGYFRLARVLKAKWEDSIAAGAESRSFGKAMMDKCQDWAAQLKADANRREQALQLLLAECEYRPGASDGVPFSEVEDEVMQKSSVLTEATKDEKDDLPDEF
jgi:hypothetical protein